MPLKRLIPTVAIGAFLAGGLAFAAVAAPVFHLGAYAPAATATSAPSPSPSASAKKEKMVAACDAFLTDFAKQLGVSPDKVKTSLKTAIKDAIDAAVKRGDMTADQATKAKAKVDSVQDCQGLPARGGHFGPRGKAGGMGGIGKLKGVINAAATALGVTPAALQDAVMSGKSLHDVAGTTVTKDAFIAKFKSALAAELKPAVDAKKITAAEAQSQVDEAATMAGNLWDTNLKSAAGGFFGKQGMGQEGPQGEEPGDNAPEGGTGIQ